MASPEAFHHFYDTAQQPDDPLISRLVREIQTATNYAADFDRQKALQLNRPIQFYPGTFDQLMAAAVSFQRFHVHARRTPDVQAAYDEAMRQKRADPFYDQAAFVRKYIMGGQPIAFVKNDYPIPLPSYHYTVWYDSDQRTIDIARFLADKLNEQNLTERPHFFMESPIKSIPEVKHFHAFFKPDNSVPSETNLIFDFP